MSASISAAQERRWNRLSHSMTYFHDHFKAEFNTLYDLADGSFNSRGLSLPSFLRIGRDLIYHLTFHHDMEETHLFPVLGKRMKEFSHADNGEHIDSHKAIHKGLDDLSELLGSFESEPSSYSPQKLRSCLDSFREVLFKHLDDEVNHLRGENMRKYWTLEEVGMIPM